MRYIDITIIEERAKRIKWTNALRMHKKHLNDLVFNDNGVDYIDWYQIEKFHLNNLDSMSEKERKAYLKKYTDWNILKHLFINEFGNKCWYSEAPLDNGVIDHFRPKNKAINYCLDETDKNHKFIIKRDGYWKLAYNLRNFRLSSHTANTRFTDMESDKAIMGGKSIYFPLHFENGTCIIADDNDKDPDVSEVSLLLDPIKPADSGFITFDENGDPIFCGHRENQKLKANISINLYNLTNTLNFVRKRQETWKFIERTIKETAMYLNNIHKNDKEKQREEDNCFSIIRQHIDKKMCFSSVALACFEIHKANPEFQFLTSFKP